MNAVSNYCKEKAASYGMTYDETKMQLNKGIYGVGGHIEILYDQKGDSVKIMASFFIDNSGQVFFSDTDQFQEDIDTMKKFIAEFNEFFTSDTNIKIKNGEPIDERYFKYL